MNKSVCLIACALVFSLSAACQKKEELPPSNEAPGSALESPQEAPAGKSATTMQQKRENATEVEEDRAGKDIYFWKCSSCHATGISGAPKLGDQAAWDERIARGREILYSHAINGYEGATGIMPAKGGFPDLTEEQVKAAVDFMVEQSGQTEE
jgi:cytochrome c5